MIRTCDTGFRRAVLYPLSYGGGRWELTGSYQRSSAITFANGFRVQLLHGDVGDAVDVAVSAYGVGDFASSSPTALQGRAQISSSDRSGRNRRVIDRSGTPESSVGIAVTAIFSSSSSNRSPAALADEIDAVGEWIGVHRDRGAAGQPDDVRPLRGEGQQPVAVACDEDRHVGHVLVHVLGHMAQPVDALASASDKAVRPARTPPCRNPRRARARSVRRTDRAAT